MVDTSKCIGCGLCVHACPTGVISLSQSSKAVINSEGCFECGVCVRICPVSAINVVQLPFPQNFKLMSNPALPKITGIPGRGTDEVKTNDVTGRIRRGEVGFAIDVGRPNVGTSLEEVVKILNALENAGVELEKENPQMTILEALRSGKVTLEELRKIRVMSMVLEGKTPLNNLVNAIRALKEIESEIDTVFSLGIICRFNDDLSLPCYDLLEDIGINPMPFGKINLGFGKPLVNE
ncbi:MAG: 4Fe-4S binding protein [Sulfolobales archaeon]|nr:4Fe-4S binding protein [Sulfolobales archaeon]